MRNLSIKLVSIDQLQELNSIIMSLVERTYFESEELIDLLNLRDLLKKLADKIFFYSNRRVKKLTITIEINQFRSLQKLFEVSTSFLKEEALNWHKHLLMDILGQCFVQFETKYIFELNSHFEKLNT